MPDKKRLRNLEDAHALVWRLAEYYQRCMHREPRFLPRLILKGKRDVCSAIAKRIKHGSGGATARRRRENGHGHDGGKDHKLVR